MTSDTPKDSDKNSSAAKWRVTLEDALARLPGAGGERFAQVFERGSLSVEIYAPRGTDPQTHTRATRSMS